MNETEIATNLNGQTETEIARLDGVRATLDSELRAARTQATSRQEEIAKAQAEIEKLVLAYQEECRKLALGGDAKITAAKARLDALQPKIDGLRLVLEEEQSRVPELEQQLAVTEKTLSELRETDRFGKERDRIVAILKPALEGVDALPQELERARELLEEMTYEFLDNKTLASQHERWLYVIAKEMKGWPRRPRSQAAQMTTNRSA